MRPLILSLIFGWIAAAPVHGAVVDLSALQSQFEQKVIDRLHMGLDPILGKEKYSITVRSDYKVQNEQLRPVDTYFPKLGMTAPTPSAESTHVIQFERWVQTVDIELARSEDMTGVSDDYLKARVAQILKPMGTFKQKVSVTTFKSAQPPITTQFIDRVPWTPIAIVSAAFLLAFFLWLAARSLASATTTAASTTAAAANVGAGGGGGFGGEFDIEKTESAAAVQAVAGDLSHEGLHKWHEWLKEDTGSARDFVERLTRSMDPSERSLLAYVFQHSDLTLVRPLLKKVSKECLATIKGSLSVPLEMAELIRSDKQLSQVITQYYVDESLDSDNMIKTVHDFSIEECVFAVENEPGVLAVFMKCLSTPHMEKIVGLIPNEQFQTFLNEADQLSVAAMTKLATQARTAVMERRKALEARQVLPLTKWMVVASHLDGEKEQAFYVSAAHKLPAAELVQFASENFPHFLSARLSDAVLKPVLNSYTFEERAELLFTIEEEARRRYLSFYESETRVSDLLSVELEQIANEPTRARAVSKRKNDMDRDFLNRVRKFVRSTPEMQAAAEDLVRVWVEEQKGNRDGAQAA